MTKISNIIKKTLLGTIFIVLFIPILYKSLFKNEFHPLKGEVYLPSDVIFNKADWFSTDYQQKKTGYLNEMFGLRSMFVRANNQLAYSLFNEAKVKSVIIGKDNFLYEENYITSFYGKNFMGDDSVANTIARLKFVSDTLTKLGKQLIVVFAPSKASFYPEYIPDRYLPINNKTNYKSFSSAATAAQLNIIDFNKWFIDNKQKSKYPLYPKYGIHWSTYGAVLAADSLTKKIGELRHVSLPKIKITEIKLSKPFDVDYDLADGMNLILKNKSFDMAYPKTYIETTNETVKPKVLVISDSFYWALYSMGISACFNDPHFWYYNKLVFPESTTNELLTDDLNFANEINKYEVIVIISTESTLDKIGWGFIENAEKHFKNSDEATVKTEDYNQKVRNFIGLIKKDSKWLSDATKRAKERNISLDSCLVLEAMWQIDHAK